MYIYNYIIYIYIYKYTYEKCQNISTSEFLLIYTFGCCLGLHSRILGKLSGVTSFR